MATVYNVDNVIPLLTDHHFDLLAGSIESEQNTIAQEIEVRKKRMEDEKLQLEKLEQRYFANEKVLLSLSSKQTNGQHQNDEVKNGVSYIIKTSRQLFAQKPNVNYNSEWETWDKIKFILEREERLMTARQILDELYGYEPEKKQLPDDEKYRFETKVFTAINYKVNKGQLQRHKGDNDKEYKNGLPDWFSPEGKPKPLYLL